MQHFVQAIIKEHLFIYNVLNLILLKTNCELQPFLAYPAVIKLRHGGEQRSFDSLWKAEDFVSSLSQKRAFAAAPQGSRKAAAALSSARREGLDGWDRGDAGSQEEDGGGRDMDAC